MDSIPEIEKEQVVNAYSKIAFDFSRTRYKVWPGVRKFIESLPSDYKILEAGCGNGKNMLIRPQTMIGIDNCQEFVDLCKAKKLDVLLGDICDIKFDDNTFDASISVAVIHHLSTEERRIKSVKEMIRVTKKGNPILIEVWGHELNNKSGDEKQDRIVEWKDQYKKLLCERYYHFFKKEEIIKICETAGLKISSIIEDTGNYLIIGNI